VRADDEAFERLRAAIDELAVGEAADLLAEARAEARARVRAMLSDALAHAMLEQVESQLAVAPAPKRQDPAPAPRRDGDRAWYVYGVIAGAPAPSLREELTVVREGPLAAVAGAVPLEEFGEARLREHLADMAWVEATARAHEQVLDLIRRQVTVIPMRMCTVYRTEGGIREMLRRESEALTEALADLDGKTEWGVKVILHDTGDRPDAEGTAGAGTGTGAAYMESRRRERDREEQAARLVEEACEQIHERLSNAAADALLAAPQRPEVSGHQGEMVLNGAYLVEDSTLEAFRDEVATLQDAFSSLGLELEMTGPWPAYNFVPGTIGAAW
jgi:hypothetical protein